MRRRTLVHACPNCGTRQRTLPLDASHCTDTCDARKRRHHTGRVEHCPQGKRCAKEWDAR